MFNQITIAERLRDAFLRHRVLFALSVLLVSGITTGAILLRSKTYQATASTQVVTDNQQVAEALGEKYRYLYVSSAQQHVNHFDDLINDDLPGGFWDTALKNANLTAPINFDPKANDPRFTRLRKQLYATADSNSLFSIGLTWSDRAECERIVEALQQQYIAEVGQEQQIKSLGTTNFLQKELADYEKRLEDAEQALSRYKSLHSGVLPNAQAAEYDNLSSAKAQRDDLQIAAQDGTETIKAIQQQLAITPPKVVTEQTLSDSPSARVLGNLQAERIQILATGVTPENNRIKYIDQQIKQVERTIAAERAQIAKETANGATVGSGTSVSQTKVQDNPQYTALTQRLGEARIEANSAVERLKIAEQQVAAYEKRIASISIQEKELNRRTRDYDNIKTIYQDLKSRLESSRIKGQLDQVTAADTLIRVGAIFAAPTQSNSKTLMMVAGSLILGLIVATGMVVLAEWSDPTLRYPDDVERFLDIPVLAAVPDMAEIDTSSTGGAPAPGMLPDGSGDPNGYRYGRNTGGLAARNPSMGAFGP